MTPTELFHKQGFLGPIKLYEPDAARAILAETRIGNQDRSHILFDNAVNYDRHFDIPELARHISHPRLIEALRPLLGDDILCWRTEFFPKFPGSKATEWHQVGTYQYASGTPFLEPTQPRENEPIDLTVWTAFTEATVENGCMRFLPGSHRKLYYDESKAPKRGRDDVYTSVKADSGFFGYDFEDFKVDPSWNPETEPSVSMEMQPGECVIFTARCVHASHPNIIRRSTRFAIAARFVPTHVRVYPDMTGFHAHGGTFDLAQYGCVLVSGRDEFKHNRIRATDNWDVRFDERAQELTPVI